MNSKIPLKSWFRLVCCARVALYLNSRLLLNNIWVLLEHFHVLDEHDTLVVVEHLRPLARSLSKDVLGELVAVAQTQEVSGLHGHHHECLLVVRVVAVGVVARLLQQDADVPEVVSFLQHAVFVHRVAVHYVHFPRKNEVDVLRGLPRVLDYWQLLIV